MVPRPSQVLRCAPPILRAYAAQRYRTTQLQLPPSGVDGPLRTCC